MFYFSSENVLRIRRFEEGKSVDFTDLICQKYSCSLRIGSAQVLFSDKQELNFCVSNVFLYLTLCYI